MDIEKAVDILNHLVFCGSCTTGPCKDCDRKNAKDTAIQGLKELQQYRQIGTVDECRQAREKQVAKTPDYEGDGYYDGQLVYDTWICPNCEEHYEVGYDDYDFCPKCGQHIQHEDWESD